MAKGAPREVDGAEGVGNPACFDVESVAGFLPLLPGMPLETTIGRSLAFYRHPVIAWRLLRRSGRIAIVLGYFSAAYLGVLGALLVASRL